MTVPTLTNNPLLSAQQAMDRSFGDVDPAELSKWVSNDLLSAEKTDSLASSIFEENAVHQQEFDILNDAIPTRTTAPIPTTTAPSFTDQLALLIEAFPSRKKNRSIEHFVKNCGVNVARADEARRFFHAIATYFAREDKYGTADMRVKGICKRRGVDQLIFKELLPKARAHKAAFLEYRRIKKEQYSASTAVGVTQSSIADVSKREKSNATEADPYEKVIRAFQDSNGQKELKTVLAECGERPRMAAPIRKYLNVLAVCLHHEHMHGEIRDEQVARLCERKAEPGKIEQLLAIARLNRPFYLNYYNTELKRK
ncbi:MAG TPA: hypothetical protein VLG76_07140 [Rhabdochlamydiaceae bacterium]|nr:hypothetical protein [Rhabdochlamydiaceae bacterium]